MIQITDIPMTRIDDSRPFIGVRIAILTMSDTRSLAEDTSGATLVKLAEEAGHAIAERACSKTMWRRSAVRSRRGSMIPASTS